MEGRRLLATFTVSNTNDSGPGSLSQAISDSNQSAHGPNPMGRNLIVFNIPGSGVHTIAPRSSPFGMMITYPVTIDGSSEPGFSGRPLIELDGENAGNVSGLDIVTAATVQNLIINRFAGAGISVYYAGGTGVGSYSVIRGNLIGTDATGTVALGNKVGIALNSASNNTIGGPNPGDGNLISGNSGDGINIRTSLGAGSVGDLIAGNLIGTDVSGTRPLGNGGDGIVLAGTFACTVGGLTAGAGNIIASNGGNGIVLSNDTTFHAVIVHSSQNVIEGNKIGTDATGTLDLGNGQNGIAFLPLTDPMPSSDNTIGGTAAGAGNVIILNTGLAIYPSPPPMPNTIVGNTLAPNKDQVIDLALSIVGSSGQAQVGHPFTVTYRVTNKGPGTASGVRLQLAYTSQSIVVNAIAPSQGTVAGSVVSLGTLAPGASATVALTVTPVTADPLGFRGTVTGDQLNANPADGSATLLPIPVVPVTVLRGVTLDSNGRSITTVRLAFGGGLVPGSAQDLANYRVTALGRRAKVLHIESATYDPATRTVILALIRPLPALGTFLCIEAGGPGTPGLVDTHGNGIQGTSGALGSATTAVVGLGPVLSYTDAQGNAVTLRLARGGNLELQLAPNGDAQVLRLRDPVRGRSILSGSVRRTRHHGNGRTPLPSIRNLGALDSPGIRLTNPPFISSQLPPGKAR